MFSDTRIEVTQPQEIQICTRMFDILKTTALYGTKARTLILSILIELT